MGPQPKPKLSFPPSTCMCCVLSLPLLLSCVKCCCFRVNGLASAGGRQNICSSRHTCCQPPSLKVDVCYYPRKVKDVLLWDVIHPSRSLLPEPSSLCCSRGGSPVLAVNEAEPSASSGWHQGSAPFVLALAGVIGARGVPQSAWRGCFSEPPLLSLEQRLAKDDGTLK